MSTDTCLNSQLLEVLVKNNEQEIKDATVKYVEKPIKYCCNLYPTLPWYSKRKILMSAVMGHCIYYAGKWYSIL